MLPYDPVLDRVVLIEQFRPGAYAAGRNANGRIHEGEFADVGATVNAWLGGKAPSKGLPGRPVLEP